MEEGYVEKYPSYYLVFPEYTTSIIHERPPAGHSEKHPRARPDRQLITVRVRQLWDRLIPSHHRA